LSVLGDSERFDFFRISSDKQKGRGDLFGGTQSIEHKNWEIRCDQVHEESLRQP